MRAVLQVASRASVEVEGVVVGKIDGPGLVVLLGVTHADTPALAAKLAAKVWRLRMLPGEKSCEDLDAPLLV
ncbi:MAG: D-aminoacyl-tRNA deacylase, partial [Paeniglutamicibacter terrestris]